MNKWQSQTKKSTTSRLNRNPLALKNGRNFSKLLFVFLLLFLRSHRTCNPILLHTETGIEEGNWWASHFLKWNSRQRSKICNYEREHFHKYKMHIRRPNDIQITTIIVHSSARLLQFRHTHPARKRALNKARVSLNLRLPSWILWKLCV